MPYTLVHPGFVLPLKRWKKDWFSNEALIIGSFVPDFDIIFRFTENRFHLYTFTLTNILTVIFPIGILSYLFYMVVLKKSVVYIFLNKRNMPALQLKQILSVKVLISIAVSIFLHILLDAFTHPNVYDTSLWIKREMEIPVSTQTVETLILYGPLTISSLVGGFLLVHYLLKNYSLTLKNIAAWVKGGKAYFWYIFIIVAVLFFLIKLNLNGMEKGFGLDSVLLFSLSGIFYGFIIASFLFRFILKTIAGEH